MPAYFRVTHAKFTALMAICFAEGWTPFIHRQIGDDIIFGVNQ